MKVKNGLDWYKKVFKFLSLNESYLIITTTEEQKLLLIKFINENRGCGIRLKAENKKYGLYISQGRRGNAAIVTKKIAQPYCEYNGLNFEEQLKTGKIVRYTAEYFKEIREIKNLFVHRNKSVSKNIPYDEQLKTDLWSKFRKIVFSKRGRSCEKCGSKRNLQIHHPRYIYGRKAWEYTTDEVMALCRDCHKKIHGLT